MPIYIPSSHTYIHHHYTNNGQSKSSTTNDNNSTPPAPPSEPVVYKENSSSSFGESSNPTMIVGFNNMIVYGVFESEKHYVIRISDDLDEEIDDIPEKFLKTEDSSLFEIVTLKPKVTTTTSEPSNTTDTYPTETYTTLDDVVA